VIDARNNAWALRLTKVPHVSVAGDSAPQRFAAAELERYLRVLLSGTSDEAAGQAPVCRGIDLRVEPERFESDEAYEWRADGETVTLIAGGDLGLVFAVYAFLRDVCGCIFAAPGPEGEHVPRHRTLAIHVTPTRRAPVLAYRATQVGCMNTPELYQQVIDWLPKIGMNFVHFRMHQPDGADETVQVDPQTGHRLYAEANGPSTIDEAYFNEHLLPMIEQRGLKLDFNHHNLWYWLPPGRYLPLHREWFSLVNGKRGQTLSQMCICTSNRQAMDELIGNVRQFLRTHPRVEVVGVVPEDGLGMCQCEACLAMDGNDRDAFAQLNNYLTPQGENPSLSRRYARLLNEVAAALGPEFPQVCVGGMAYVGLVFPPRDLTLAPNVEIQIAVYWRDGGRPLHDPRSSRNAFYLDLIRRWRRVTNGRLLLYEYYMGMMAQKSLPYPMAEVIAADWKALHSEGIGGASVQCMAGCYQAYAMNMTAFGGSAWGQPRSADAIAADYALAMFGPAASSLLWILQRWNDAMAAIGRAAPGDLTPDPLHPQHHALLPDGGSIAWLWSNLGGDAAVQQAVAAAQAAAVEPGHRANVQRFAIYLEYCRLAARAMRQRERARQLATSDHADAGAEWRQLLDHDWPAVIAYLQSHRLPGWVLTRSITRWQSELKGLQDESTAQHRGASRSPV
jgi:hypothetical protein